MLVIGMRALGRLRPSGRGIWPTAPSRIPSRPRTPRGQRPVTPRSSPRTRPDIPYRPAGVTPQPVVRRKSVGMPKRSRAVRGPRTSPQEVRIRKNVAASAAARRAVTPEQRAARSAAAAGHVPRKSNMNRLRDSSLARQISRNKTGIAIGSGIGLGGFWAGQGTGRGADRTTGRPTGNTLY